MNAKKAKHLRKLAKGYTPLHPDRAHTQVRSQTVNDITSTRALYRALKHEVKHA